jgi:hypothetical protein
VTRWVTRQADCKLQVRLVNVHEKLIVDISKAEYSNIGFDGEWSTVSQLMSTEQVKRMKALDDSAPTGSRWYEIRHGNLTVRVLWNELQEFPRKIESAAANRLYRSSVTAAPQALPAIPPWTQLKALARKEYTDFLYQGPSPLLQVVAQVGVELVQADAIVHRNVVNLVDGLGFVGGGREDVGLHRVGQEAKVVAGFAVAVDEDALLANHIGDAFGDHRLNHAGQPVEERVLRKL